MSMLNYALLAVRDQMLTLRYTDLQVTIVTSFPLEAIEEEGEVCVPLKLLMDSVKKTPDVPLHFEVDSDMAEMKVAFDDGMRRSHWKFSVRDSIDYFEMPDLDPEITKNVDLTTDILADGIDKTLYCASSQNSSANGNVSLVSVHMEFTPEGMWFGATDSQRIGMCDNRNVRVEEACGVTLPSKAAQVIAALLPSEPEELQLSFDDRGALFAMPSMQIYTLLIDKPYPEIRKFFAQEVSHEVVVNTQLLLDSVRQLAPFATPAKMNAKYEFTDSQVELRAYSETYSALGTQLIACEYSGEPFSVMLSIPFVAESLAKLSSQEVRLQFGSSFSFAIVKPAQPEAEGVEYAVYIAVILM